MSTKSDLENEQAAYILLLKQLPNKSETTDMCIGWAFRGNLYPPLAHATSDRKSNET